MTEFTAEQILLLDITGRVDQSRGLFIRKFFYKNFTLLLQLLKPASRDISIKIATYSLEIGLSNFRPVIKERM